MLTLTIYVTNLLVVVNDLPLKFIPSSRSAKVASFCGETLCRPAKSYSQQETLLSLLRQQPFSWLRCEHVFCWQGLSMTCWMQSSNRHVVCFFLFFFVEVHDFELETLPTPSKSCKMYVVGSLHRKYYERLISNYVIKQMSYGGLCVVVRFSIAHVQLLFFFFFLTDWFYTYISLTKDYIR